MCIRDRPKGDPIGRRGLPSGRIALDGLLARLRILLVAAGSEGIQGERLAAALELAKGTRALRALVAYGQVHHHIHQIVGVPGKGYFWGDCVEGLYKRMARSCEKFGRDYFYKGALMKRQGLAMATVQMVFNFMEHEVPAARRFNDDLAALVASEGVTVADVMNAMVGSLRETPEGRAVLADVGRKHADVLVAAETLERLGEELEKIRNELLAAATRASAV